jgi:hypothetical protein
MVSSKVFAKFAPAALAAALIVLPACSVNVRDKDKNGEAHVDIQSPMGNVHVNEQPDIRDTGLALYAGARPAPKENGDDKKSANVDLSGFGFSLKVVAAEFQSDDSPDKILSFYNKQLQRFGKPIECHGKWNGGDVNTDINDKDKGAKPVSCRQGESGESVELKVGTEDNQHVVAVKPEGKGTRFALVYVRTHAGKDDTI